MAITNSINTKSNVKQKTEADLLSNLGQPVIARENYVSTAGQTSVPASGSLPFSIDQNNKENFELFIDGRLLTEGAAADYTFSEIDGNNRSSKISLNAALPAGLNIVAIKRGIKKESDQGVDARVVAIQDSIGSGFQSFVAPAELISVPNTQIVNRAQIRNPANDLRVSMGLERIAVQHIYEIPTEQGSNAERVFGATGDDKGLIRFVGAWSVAQDTNGVRPGTTDTASYAEVTFYGTGLNLLCAINSTRDHRVTVDGGSESANIMISGNAALQGRNPASNQVISLVSGLSLGIHTVKIRNASATGADWYGFEVVGGTSVKVNAGTAFASGKKLSASDTTFAHNSVATGTRGGRVITYVKSDGTIGNSWQAVDASAKYDSLADHTNEEIIRSYYPREFGANRSDDFTTMPNTSSNRAFTLEDGSTTLIGSAVANNTTVGLPEGLYLAATSAFWSFTFVGTGLDLSQYGTSTATDTGYTLIVDGNTITSTFTVTSNLLHRRKIVSGLPYGTHTVKLIRTGAATNVPTTVAFHVHGPKKPSLPSGAIELADYNVMANFVANTVQNTNTISTGVIRKVNVREMVYSGANWAVGAIDLTSSNAFVTATASINGQYVEYTFFGTGFDWRFYMNGAANWIVSVDGNTNLSAYTTSIYGGTGAFNAATGAVTGSFTNIYGNGLVVNGLPLGLHKVRITTVGTVGLYHESFDIITPVHSPVSKGIELQNTLPVGSCAISDNRRTSPMSQISPSKFRGSVFGIQSGPSINSTAYLTIPDMSIAVLSPGAWFRIQCQGTFVPTAGGGPEFLAIFINGLKYGNDMDTGIGSGVGGAVFIGYSNPALVYLPKGAHLIEWKWRTSGNTLSGRSVARTMTVEEI